MKYTMDENMKYETAMKEIESIVAEMESGTLELDTLTEKLKRAQTLIQLCKKRLTDTDNEVKRILDSQK
ncbi:MAG: exodeoxyribonuclease VII small subunit [Bacteroidales bacterium]|nr:exodeoxyribonuclease VII small subunit [Bacteroidales bacterium]MDD6493341.1 exodeoxyribonuclease VII small subunit [Bacteroidales bacterium]MDY4926918.1 exodeoxyribonuclease VII small subunit [Prevotella sp.]MDY5034771.1 exodeoxyribonuclease VII small subunit [Prevotella sp.]